MAFQIIRHAFQMVFGNFGQALRVSVGPYIVLLIGYFLILGFVGASGFEPAALVLSDGTQGFSGIGLLALMLLIPFTLFVLAWIAVSWHRFILLEEYTGVLPAVAGRPIWPYVGRSILLAFLIMLLAIPLFFIAGIVASPFISVNTGASSSMAAVVIFVFVAAILSYVWFRIGLALPAIAVGQPIPMSEAWSSSSGMSGTIFGLACLLIFINGVATLIVSIASESVPIIGFAADIAVQWLTVMLGVSVLTTLYGHLIEKRPLVD